MGTFGALALTMIGVAAQATGTTPPAPVAAEGAVLGCQSTSGNYPWGRGAFRVWTPASDTPWAKPYEKPGQATGAPFTARLIRAYGDDVSADPRGAGGGMSRMAEFEMRDGCRRRFRVDSLAPADRKAIEDVAALHPLKPDMDTATYSVAFDGRATPAALADGTLGKAETKHFVFWYGMNRDAAGYRWARDAGIDWQVVLKRWGDFMERAWVWNQQLLKAPMPFAGRPDRKKVNIYLCGTGFRFTDQLLMDNDIDHCPSRTYDAAFMSPMAIMWPMVPAHEFVHLIEYHTGGMRGNTAFSIWETFAEWDVYSLGRSMAGFLGLSANNLENSPFWATVYGPYGTYPFITFLWDQDRTRDLVWRPWTDGLRKQDGDAAENYIQAFVRLGRIAGLYPDGFRSFADDMGWYGARLAAMDFVPQREMLDAMLAAPGRSLALSRTTALAADAAPGVWRSPPDRPLRTFGTHLIPLTATGGPVSVTLTGGTTADDAAWRFSIVAVRGDTDVSYSALGRASAMGSGTVSRPVPAGARLYLAVTATPGIYEVNQEQGPGPVQGTAFPYRVSITGADPAKGPVDPCAGDPPAEAFLSNYNTNGNDSVGKPCPGH